MKHSSKIGIKVVACCALVAFAASCGNKKSGGGEGKFGPAARSQASSTDSDASSNSEAMQTSAALFHNEIDQSPLSPTQRNLLHIAVDSKHSTAQMRLTDPVVDGGQSAPMDPSMAPVVAIATDMLSAAIAGIPSDPQVSNDALVVGAGAVADGVASGNALTASKVVEAISDAVPEANLALVVYGLSEDHAAAVRKRKKAAMDRMLSASGIGSRICAAINAIASNQPPATATAMGLDSDAPNSHAGAGKSANPADGHGAPDNPGKPADPAPKTGGGSAEKPADPKSLAAEHSQGHAKLMAKLSDVCKTAAGPDGVNAPSMSPPAMPAAEPAPSGGAPAAPAPMK